MKENNVDNDVMIDAKNISMKFNLGIEKGFSIKQFFVDLLSYKRRKKVKNDFYALTDVCVPPSFLRCNFTPRVNGIWNWGVCLRAQ